MAEIDIRNVKQLIHWINNQANSENIGLLFSIRNIIRLFPLIRMSKDRSGPNYNAFIWGKNWNDDVFFPLIISVFAIFNSIKYPNKNFEIILSKIDLSQAANLSGANPVADAILYLSLYIQDKNGIHIDQSIIAPIIMVENISGNIGLWNYNKTIYNSIDYDIRSLVGVDGISKIGPDKLLCSNVWPEGIPEWAIENLRLFSEYFQSLHGSWYVWKDWYSARLNGGNAFGLDDAAAERVETGIVLLPDEVWEAGPEAVNTAIHDLIQKERAGEAADAAAGNADPAADEGDLPPIEAIPPQDQRGASFGGEPDEPIGLAPMQASDRLRATPERQEDYDDIRQKAEALRAEGENRVGHLMGALTRFLDLSADLSQVRAQLFWSRVNTLRIKHNGHRDAIEEEKKTGEKDERRLDAVVADLLADLIETINAFHLGDPTLVEFDAARPGPKDIAQIRLELAPILPVLREVADKPEIVAADASEVIKESIEEAAHTGESLAERQSVEASSRTLRNFVTTMLHRAYRPLKKFGGAIKQHGEFAGKEALGGFYKDMGAAFAKVARYTAVALFISANKTYLIAYVTQAFPNAPALVHIINLIAKSVGM